MEFKTLNDIRVFIEKRVEERAEQAQKTANDAEQATAAADMATEQLNAAIDAEDAKRAAAAQIAVIITRHKAAKATAKAAEHAGPVFTPAENNAILEQVEQIYRTDAANHYAEMLKIAKHLQTVADSLTSCNATVNGIRSTLADKMPNEHYERGYTSHEYKIATHYPVTARYVASGALVRELEQATKDFSTEQ